MRSSFRIHGHDPLSIVADGLDRTFLQRRQTPGFFRGITRLPAHVTMPLRIFTKKVERSGLSTEIAVDASIVDVIPARHVLSCFPSLIRHALAIRSGQNRGPRGRSIPLAIRRTRPISSRTPAPAALDFPYNTEIKRRRSASTRC